MNIVSQVISLLNRPFPFTEGWRKQTIVAVGVALFVTFFLYVFEPFGLMYVKENKFLICLGFGLVTLISSLIVGLICVKILRIYDEPGRYTLGKWILQAICLIMTISIANFLFGRWLHGNMNWEFLPNMIYGTFAVGVFPTVVLGTLAMLRQEKLYQNIASGINSQESLETTTKKVEGRKVADIPITNIRYIESYQNYVKIGYIDRESVINEEVQRATLKSLQEELQATVIVKCHRSYLVNKTSIISVSGNAQGLLLTLQGCDKSIPVSRSFVPAFR